MPLPGYQYRPATPPREVPGLIEGLHSRHASGSSVWSVDSSPESHIYTPRDTSPIRHHGPSLLPKIRTQDQSVVDSSIYVMPAKTHRRALSNTFNPPAQAPLHRPVQRAASNPPDCVPENAVFNPSPSSATTNFSFSSFLNGETSTVQSPVGAPVPRRGIGHLRTASTPSIDEALFSRYAQASRRNPKVANWTQYVAPVSTSSTASDSAALPAELCFSLDEETVTSKDYLSSANPALDLCRQVNTVIGRGMHTHFWWDIRNVVPWEGFSLETIMGVPSMPELLGIPINQSALPQPTLSGSRLFPETEAALTMAVNEYYAAKINSAMKVAQGSRRLAMRLCRERDGPAFVSNYQDDAEKTISGNGRGRIVGIVRSYHRWNSGMRSGNGNDKVRYLEGLSQLHHHMRQHQTRYGFIITETELVCARAGTDDIPYFGFLELSTAVETRATEGLTACLALWWLHMLAKEEPLPGQRTWRMQVGAPSAMTRQNVLPEKDKWIPLPQTGEKRDAKRVRGWVFPKDPWNKKREGGKVWNRT